MTNCWGGTRVFLTGHTGFKGGWMALALSELGAAVHGYALAAPDGPGMFRDCRIEGTLASHTVSDVCDLGCLLSAMGEAKPEVVFHLAAQSLVRRSYREPVQTYATNVMGTAHVLHAASETPSVRAVVVVTSDKCYENLERTEPYREGDAMGGFDPYSSSKGCAELVTAAWRQSYLAPKGVRVATARAGNVIGGGDWAEDRLVPDFLRALDDGRELVIRSPSATRPWQHVLEPISGYLSLAARLLAEGGEKYAEAWNFGPTAEGVRDVRWVLERLCEGAPEARWRVDGTGHPHEAGLLVLDSTKAREHLGWTPRWDAVEAIRRTLDWHRAWRGGADMRAFSIAQWHEHRSASTCAAGPA